MFRAKISNDYPRYSQCLLTALLSNHDTTKENMIPQYYLEKQLCNSLKITRHCYYAEQNNVLIQSAYARF